MLRYYIEIPADNVNKKLAAELKSKHQLTDLELQKAVIEFAQEEGICPSLALSKCMHKVETVDGDWNCEICLPDIAPNTPQTLIATPLPGLILIEKIQGEGAE